MLFEFNDNDDLYDLDLSYFNLDKMDKLDNNKYSMNLKNSNDLDLENGYFLGNIFSNIYDPYKNYKPKKINSYSEQQKMLVRIYELDFIENDLALYLDIHPNDTKVFEIFKRVNKELENLKKKYYEKYEVLELICDNKSKYTWIDDPWPWDGGYYV